MTAAEQVPPVDLRTRIAAAFEAEDARNWGYDHGFEADDFETLAFADVAIAVMAGEVEQLRADVARYDTALIEAVRDAADDDEPHDDGVTVSQAAMEETLAAADEDRDRLEAELAAARAEAKAARVGTARLVGAVELWLDNGALTVAGTEALRALIAGDDAPVCRYHDAPDETCTCPDEVLAARHGASRAPESPAGAPTPGATPDA